MIGFFLQREILVNKLQRSFCDVRSTADHNCTFIHLILCDRIIDCFLFIISYSKLKDYMWLLNFIQGVSQRDRKVFSVWIISYFFQREEIDKNNCKNYIPNKLNSIWIG